MMTKRQPGWPSRIALPLMVVCFWPAVAFGQINVIISGGFRAVYSAVLPEFERTTGLTVNTVSGASQGDGPDTIAAQLRRQVPADLVIMNRVGLADLIREGRILSGTDALLAETPLGVAVRVGATEPDIATTDAFKRALLAADRVAIDSSTTGIYLTTTLFPRLGIADALAKKTVAAAADVVATGNADLAIRPISELLPVKGIELVGRVPADSQFVAVFAAGIVTGSNRIEAAKRLMAFLESEQVSKALSQYGMERPRAR